MCKLRLRQTTTTRQRITSVAFRSYGDWYVSLKQPYVKPQRTFDKCYVWIVELEIKQCEISDPDLWVLLQYGEGSDSEQSH